MLSITKARVNGVDKDVTKTRVKTASSRDQRETNRLNLNKSFGGKGGTRTLDPGIMSAGLKERALAA